MVRGWAEIGTKKRNTPDNYYLCPDCEKALQGLTGRERRRVVIQRSFGIIDHVRNANKPPLEDDFNWVRVEDSGIY